MGKKGFDFDGAPSVLTDPDTNKPLPGIRPLDKQQVVASQTKKALSSASGGTGAKYDYLSHIVIQPLSTSPGEATVFDNATEVYSFPGGTDSVSNLAPVIVMLGADSKIGPWKITTGANVEVTAFGKFSV